MCVCVSVTLHTLARTHAHHTLLLKCAAHAAASIEDTHTRARTDAHATLCAREESQNDVCPSSSHRAQRNRELIFIMTSLSARPRACACVRARPVSVQVRARKVHGNAHSGKGLAREAFGHEFIAYNRMHLCISILRGGLVHK